MFSAELLSPRVHGHRQSESGTTAGHAIVLDPGKLCRKMGNAICKRICMPTRLYSRRGGMAFSGWTKEYRLESARLPRGRHTMAIATNATRWRGGEEVDLPAILPPDRLHRVCFCHLRSYSHDRRQAFRFQLHQYYQVAGALMERLIGRFRQRLGLWRSGPASDREPA